MNWYYESAGQQQGPISDSELDRLLAEGKITPDTLVWREGLPTWAPLRSTRASLETAAPPPLAGSAPAVPPADVPPGYIRCSMTGKYFPPSEIIYLEGRPYSAEAKPQVLQSLQTGALLPGDEAGRTGPAWENRQQLGIPQALWQTIREVLRRPAQTFANMRREGGLQTPLFFNLILGSAAGIFSQLIVSIVQYFFLSSQPAVAGGPALAVGMVGGGLIGGVIMAPVQVALGAFFGAGVTHLCLMLVKGANRPFETTFRTLCYLYGAMAPVQFVIAVLAGLATLRSFTPGAAIAQADLGLYGAGIAGVTLPMVVWYLYVAIVGLAATQEITRGRAALAILMPMIACCVFAVIAALLIGGVVAATR